MNLARLAVAAIYLTFWIMVWRICARSLRRYLCVVSHDSEILMQQIEYDVATGAIGSNVAEALSVALWRETKSVRAFLRYRGAGPRTSLQIAEHMRERLDTERMKQMFGAAAIMNAQQWIQQFIDDHNSVAYRLDRASIEAFMNHQIDKI